MNHRLQQSFVAQDDSCTITCVDASFLLQPFDDETCLNVFRWCTKECNIFLLFEVIVYLFAVIVQFIGKLLQIFSDISTCLMLCLPSIRLCCIHIIMVVIPIKCSLALFMETMEKLSFYRLKDIEPHKQIFLVCEIHHWCFSHLIIEHTLIGKPL